MNDILYARPISPLSNGVYLMSLRPSVAEQSVRDPSGVGPFSNERLSICSIDL